MNKDSKIEIAKMQSLMERMDRHCSLTESREIESKCLSENGIYESGSASWKYIAGPDEFYDFISSIPNGNFVTFGYVNVAKIEVPEGKRLNPATNRMNKFDDYEALGKNLGVNGNLVGVIKLSIYNFPWQTEKKVNTEYSKWKEDRDEIAKKYGVEIKKAPYQTSNMNFGNAGGVSAFNGTNDELKGHTYTNLNMFNIKPKSDSYYLVMEDGKLEEIDINRLTKLPYKKTQTIIDKLKDAGATTEEIAPLLNMNYQRFEHSHLLFFSATANGVPTVYINTKLSDKIKGITLADPNQLINIAKERYSKFM